MVCTALAMACTATSQTVPTIQWHTMIGGSELDHCQALLAPEGDGIVVVGRSNSTNGAGIGNHGLTDALVAKLDMDGSIQWHRMYGGAAGDGANEVTRCLDGYAFIGTTRSVDGDAEGPGQGLGDVWVVRVNEAGDLIWQRKYGGPLNDEALSIASTADGGFLFTASIGSSSTGGDIANDLGIGGYWLVKLDSTGAIQWQNRFGGSSYDVPYSMRLTPDGGCIIAGYTWSDDGDVTGYHPGENGDGWVVKADHLGNLQWQQALGGSGDDLLLDVVQAGDGGYVISGYTESTDGDVSGSHGGVDGWVVKLDTDGNLVWQRTMGGTGTDQINAVAHTADGGFIVAGTTNSLDGDVTVNLGEFDGWVVKLDSTGNLLWELSMGGNAMDNFWTIVQVDGGGFLLAGDSESNDGDATGNHGGQDGWVVKLGPEPNGILERPAALPVALHPNPVQNMVQVQYAVHAAGAVRVEVRNYAGQLVLPPMQQQAAPGPQGWMFDASTLVPGVYQLRLVTSEGTVSKGLVKVR